jgi:hypothetical protein
LEQAKRREAELARWRALAHLYEKKLDRVNTLDPELVEREFIDECRREVGIE